MTKRQLIVTGDDVGRTESLTKGVIEAHERGILTSASIVARGPYFDSAVDLLQRHPRLAVGVHLYVDEYPPVSPPEEIPTLVSGDGRFPARARSFLRILTGRARREELLREWSAQIRRVQDAGFQVSHVDGHGHCHVAPAAAGVVAELCETLGIGAARLPAEPLSYCGAKAPFSPSRRAEQMLLTAACTHAKKRWRDRLDWPDVFFGFMDSGRLSRRSLEVMVSAMPAGVSELMSHPGVSNDDEPFGLQYDWRGDLEALCTFSKEEFENRFGVSLVSHREAWT